MSLRFCVPRPKQSSQFYTSGVRAVCVSGLCSLLSRPTESRIGRCVQSTHQQAALRPRCSSLAACVGAPLLLQLAGPRLRLRLEFRFTLRAWVVGLDLATLDLTHAPLLLLTASSDRRKQGVRRVTTRRRSGRWCARSGRWRRRRRRLLLPSQASHRSPTFATQSRTTRYGRDWKRRQHSLSDCPGWARGLQPWPQGEVACRSSGRRRGQLGRSDRCLASGMSTTYSALLRRSQCHCWRDEQRVR